MRNWPLRWKVALYSALLALTATLGGAVTTWFVLREAEIAAFDRGLTTDAQEFFRDVEHFEGGRRSNRPVFKEIFVPLSLRKHLVEVSDAGGTVLYMSPRLRQPFPRDGIKTFHNHRIEGQNIRVAEFNENGLTLRAGDDLKAINQTGRDILFAMLGAIPVVLLVTLLGAAWVASKGALRTKRACKASGVRSNACSRFSIAKWRAAMPLLPVRTFLRIARERESNA